MATQSVESFYQKHKSEILEFIARDQSPRLTTMDLEKRLIDSKGKQWYGFSKDQGIPLQRHGKALGYMRLLVAGFTRDEEDEVYKTIFSLWSEGLKNPTVAAKIFYLFTELHTRGKTIVHEEVLINFMCVLLVREDEDPAIFNKDIHQEKIDQITEEFAKGNHYFFFQLPELKNGLELWRLSEEEATKLLEDSRDKVKQWPEVLKTIRSFARTRSTQKNSENVS